MEGFHASALNDLERLLPLLKHAEPLIYYDVVNSYAVELIEHDRLSEARNVSLVAVSSPLGPFYPEWRETLLDVKSKRKQRSTITISVPEFQQGYEPKEAIVDNPIQEARVDAVIDFMTANLPQEHHVGSAMPSSQFIVVAVCPRVQIPNRTLTNRIFDQAQDGKSEPPFDHDFSECEGNHGTGGIWQQAPLPTALQMTIQYYSNHVQKTRS